MAHHSTSPGAETPYQKHLHTRSKLGRGARFGRCEVCGFFDTVRYVLSRARASIEVRAICPDCSAPNSDGLP